MSGYIGMPTGLDLQLFGVFLEDVFETTAYHVGSSVEHKKFRDVDVRVLLDRAAWGAWGFYDPDTNHVQDAKWIALCRAFSELGRKMTGLPIDFQIQQREWANKNFPLKKHTRSALGLVPWKFKGSDK